MKFIFYCTFLALSLTTCRGPKQLAQQIDYTFKTAYSGQMTYGKKTKQMRKKILMDFYKTVGSRYATDKNPLYIIENINVDGGNFDRENIKTYFWQSDNLIEVYNFDGFEKKLEKREKENWGIENSLPTIKTIVEKIKLSDSESLNKLHSKVEFQISNPGTYYVTVLEYDWTISHSQIIKEFLIPPDLSD